MVVRRDRQAEKLLQPYVPANHHGLDLVVIVCDAGSADDPTTIRDELGHALGSGRLYSDRTAIGVAQPGIEAWLLGCTALPGEDEQNVKTRLRQEIQGVSTRDYRNQAEKIDVVDLASQPGPFRDLAAQIACVLGLTLPPPPSTP